MATLYHGSAAKRKTLKVPRKNSGGVVWATTDKKTAEGYAALSHKRRFTGSSKHAYVHTMNESKSWKQQGRGVHSSNGPVKPSGGYWINRDNFRASKASHPNMYNRHDRTIKSGAAAVGVVGGVVVAHKAYKHFHKQKQSDRTYTTTKRKPAKLRRRV